MTALTVVIIAVAAALVAGFIAFICGFFYRKSVSEKQIGSANDEARRIINEAIKTADTKKKEAILEAKEQLHKERTEQEREIKERRVEVTRQEKRLQQREEILDRKYDNLDRKEEQLNSKLKKAEELQQEMEEQKRAQIAVLERISGYTAEAAKAELLHELEQQLEHDYAVKIAEHEARYAENADEKARQIVDDALKVAETKKREALLEVKEESLKTKNELERETKERRAELQRYEKRVLSKEEAVDKKADAIERRETGLAAKEEEIKKRSNEVEKLTEQRVQELERISGLTSEQAKEYLLKTVEDEVKHDTAKLYKELESRAKEEAGKKAKEYVVNAIQKCAADHVAETTISVVQLPNDEMKGRIIGREGRNIRTLETMTGVDLIIDDTPEAVILSGFDPIRREVARIALEKLIVDGRIHPARIEEMVEKAQKEVENMIREEGEAATLEVGVHGIHPELVRLLGRMKFRTSYGQNALKHSIEVAQLSGLLAGEIGVDVRMAKRAGLLHDIGKSIDHEVEGSHIQIGADLCKKYKESPLVINAVEAHHGDVEPESLIACIVQAADTISAARPGARRETLETYTNRLKQLEDITNSFKGVDKSFAIQAGREIRIMVVPEQVSDADMVLLARDVAKQIEAELEYPGQIKVSVIRESRAVDYAK